MLNGIVLYNLLPLCLSCTWSWVDERFFFILTLPRYSTDISIESITLPVTLMWTVLLMHTSARVYFWGEPNTIAYLLFYLFCGSSFMGRQAFEATFRWRIIGPGGRMNFKMMKGDWKLETELSPLPPLLPLIIWAIYRIDIYHIFAFCTTVPLLHWAS